MPHSSDPPVPALPRREPVILAVDDEPAVLSSVARDLRREYGGDYRVLRARSGEAALEILSEIRLRDEPLALLVADQRMPGMTGVELLGRARELFPDAKRVLLTAYADTDAAIRAINEVRLDHYLLKPWDPPEERLYPVLTDLLDDWRAAFEVPFEGVRVVGHRWSAEAHRVRDFLARNLMPYRWFDVEDDAEARSLLELAGAEGGPFPVLFFPDGSHLVQPENAAIAAKMGLSTVPRAAAYDLVIVGAGPAGLGAAVYGASEGLRTLLVERDAPGGQAGMSSSIENYLGFPVGLSGADLSRRAVAQAARFGAEILSAQEATGLRIQGGYPVVELSDGSSVTGQALLVSTGVAYRLLEVPGADHLAGAGIYYGAAITEALAVRGRDVFILGGGNSAGQAAIYLAAAAGSVTLLVRNRALVTTMSRYLVDRINSTQNIHVRTETEVVEAHGERALEALTIRKPDGELERARTEALFVFIGAEPRTAWVADVLWRDRQGYILSGPDVVRGGVRPPGWTAARDPLWLETSVAGVFVAGDVRHRSVKRIASAVGEGAMAVQFIHQHLNGLFPLPLRGRTAETAAGPADAEEAPGAGAAGTGVAEEAPGAAATGTGVAEEAPGAAATGTGVARAGAG